jgi:spore maturation protein CgeB
MIRRVLIAGETGNHCLEMSYYKAFSDAGYEVQLYDTKSAVKNSVRGGRWGYQVHRFFPVEAWIRKANKSFCEFVKFFQPDILIVFTGAEILPGSFAYIKSILPIRIVWYWADPLPNLSRYIFQSLVLTDLVASYSKSSLPVFSQMGAKKTCWLPFAADEEAHFGKARKQENYQFDVSFIGSWRPEREEVLKVIYENFPGFKFKISGPYWERCKFKPIRKIASSKPIYGKLFTEVVQQTFLSLNVMDTTNYPSANMRFFEILAAGGLELSSDAPEMRSQFIDGQHLLYFESTERLIKVIQNALDNKEKMEYIKSKGQQLLRSEHLYSARITELLKNL